VGAHSAWAGSPDRVGGPCSYRDYPGRGTIVSIDKPDPLSGAESGQYEVRFVFSPAGADREALSHSQGRTFVLVQGDDSLLTLPEIRKLGVSVGQSYEGKMSIIQEGTCTPVLFDFPSLRS